MKLNSFLYFANSIVKLLFVLSTLFISILNLRNLNVYQSEIKLVIKGRGDIFFLNNNFSSEPSEVIINNEIKDSYIKSYNFVKDFNNITIKFNNTIKSCESMFDGLANIIEMDLSNFDSSKVERMDKMFYKCSNLEKINFGNINTSLVKTMRNLFSCCSKLTSINLSILILILLLICLGCFLSVNH